MPRRTSKRNADSAGLTVAGLEEDQDRAAKTSRNASPSSQPNSNSGQRLGEQTEYIPLTQVAGADEEDDAANELVPDSQDSDYTSNFVLYGASNGKPFVHAANCIRRIVGILLNFFE